MKELENIYLAARELPADERDSYLDQVCAEDEDLRARLKQMLDKADAAKAFFAESAVESPGAGLTLTIEVAPQKDEGAGTVIGRYKLLQKIGEGGMGVVYMAEQTKPIQRKVALKIIKLGMDTRAVVARFEAEQQALAMMDHPNIAGVLDAGVTETGRPYFVMEIVRGIPITEFCNENKLTVEERLKLFMDVCYAVQHAHQKGIIHRDIKPSNIMVTLHGDQAVPKVIDFGIAKAIQGKLTDKTLFTQYQQFIGTPAYMSPEQASLSGLDIDTRSDIYSLGVLLYELLTGRTPLNVRKLTSAGFEELRRRIKEEEASKPSTSLSTMAGSERTTLARLRRTDAKTLTSHLSGDLDWIVMKAIEKDRSRRYETADAFRQDIGRFLNNEPVTARAPSLLYLSQKFYGRHRLPIAMASSLAFIGVTAALFGTLALKRERDIALAALAQAKTEKTISVATLNFLNNDILWAASSRKGLGKDITLREVLDLAAKKVETAPPKFPLVESAIRISLGRTYSTLGEHEKSSAQFIKGLKLKREALGEDDAQTAKDLLEAALGASRSGDARLSFEYATEAYKILKDAIAEGGDPNDPLLFEAESVILQSHFASAAQKKAGLDRLKVYLKKTEAAGEGAVDLQLILTWSLATILNDLELREDARPYWERHNELGRNHPGRTTPSFYLSQAQFYATWDQLEACEAALARCVELTKIQFNEEDPGYIDLSGGAQGELLIRQGDLPAAKRFYEKYYSQLDRTRYNASRGKVASYYALCLLFLGQEDEAIRVLDDELRNALATPSIDPALLDILMMNLSYSYALRGANGDFAKALAALPDSERLADSPDWRFHQGTLHLHLGKKEEFEKLRQDLLGRFKDSDDSFVMSQVLPTVLATPLRPSPSEDKTIRQWMGHADAKKDIRGARARAWTEFCLGLAHFRFNELKDAQMHLTAAIQGPPITEALARLVLSRIDPDSPGQSAASGHLEKSKILRQNWPPKDPKHAEVNISYRMLYDALQEEFTKSAPQALASP